jgi:hypothetical protein
VRVFPCRYTQHELIDDHGGDAGVAPVVVCVLLSTTDNAGLDAWYREEHLPLLPAIPGWRRTRRYRLVGGAGPWFLAFHEVDRVELFDLPAHRSATGTPRREAVMRAVTARESRVFGYHDTARRR